MDTVVIKISGMTCGGCVNSVRKVVSAIAGVSSVDVSLDKAQASVAFDAALAKADDFKSAIRDAGFDTD